MNLEKVTIKNYFEFVEEIKALTANKEYSMAEEVLLKIINLIEDESLSTGEGVAPAYYLELAKIYKKIKQEEKEKGILKRFLVQIKAGGKQPISILERYLKLFKDKNPEELKEEFYNCYLANVNASGLAKFETTCSCCKKKVILVRPKNSPIFRSCCPFCLESNLFF